MTTALPAQAFPDAAYDVIERPHVTRPPRYCVWMHNDDYTPMDFVIEILMSIFQFNDTTSQTLMWQIHTQGKAQCGIYSFDIAQTKIKKVAHLAATAGHPLKCTLEKIEPGE